MTWKIIPKDKLEVGRWYLGAGRGTAIALWNGGEFQFLGQKFEKYVTKFCDHYDDGPPYGCFAPFELVDDEKYPSVDLYEATLKKEEGTK